MTREQEQGEITQLVENRSGLTLSVFPAYPDVSVCQHQTSRLLQEYTMTKRTFQPNTRRRAKTHGFRERMRTRAGRAIIAARRRKGREELTA